MYTGNINLKYQVMAKAPSVVVAVKAGAEAEADEVAEA